jgi:hypothetical protein
MSNFKHLKTFESFDSREELVNEEIFGKIGFKLDDKTIKKAEDKLSSGQLDGAGGKKANSNILKFKEEEFQNWKNKWEEGEDKSGVFEKIVKHIVRNGNILYSVKGSDFRSGSSYGRDGGTGAGGGGGA